MRASLPRGPGRFRPWVASCSSRGTAAATSRRCWRWPTPAAARPRRCGRWARRRSPIGSPPRRCPSSRATCCVEWDSVRARPRRAGRGRVDADVVVSDYMLPGALCGAEASHRPSVALVHTLYAANLDGTGGLLPMQMAATVDGIAAVRAELGLPSGRHASASCSTGPPTLLVTCPEELDLPLATRAEQRALRRARCSRARAPTPAGGRRASTTAARSSSSGWARRRWTRARCCSGC